LARKPWAGEVIDNRLFAMVNLNGFRNVFLQYIDYLNVGMPDWRHGKAEIVLKDKNANLLKQLVEILEKL
jgi:hypothetical protein